MATETTTDTAPSAETSSEFEDAFAAFASGETPAPADAATDGDDDEKPGNEAPAEPAADADPAPAPPEAAPSGPADESTDEIDWSALPPAVRKAYEKVEHEAKSLRGRVSANDRLLHQLRSRPAPQAPQREEDGGKPAKPALTEEQITQLREDYPDVAGPILDMVEGLRAEVAGVRQQDEDTRVAAALAANVADLDEQMPDWRQWGTDARFEEWIVTQPRHIQEAASRNSQDIVDVGEAKDVLGRFKAAYDTPAAPPPPNPKRERQLRTGGDAQTKQPAAVNDVPDDFGSAFTSYAKKIEAKGPTR